MRVRFALGARDGQPGDLGPRPLGPARRHEDAEHMTGTRSADRGRTADVPELLRQWTDSGLITHDQAGRILRSEGLPEADIPTPRAASEPAEPAAEGRRSR